MKQPKISVAMATYNGELFLNEQLNSIIACLTEHDEIVISDDGSTDRTIEIIESFRAQDDRIHIYSGPGKGIKQNFENAIRNCSGEIIFLSDQDDVWRKDKVKLVLKEFEDPNCMVVNHNAEITDAEGTTTGSTMFEYRNSKPGIIRNIWKNSYVGCCMAFRRKLISNILPIPDDIEMHDQWIGIIGERNGKSVFLDENLIGYRRHGANASEFHHHSIPVMIANRICFIGRLLQREFTKTESNL